MKGKETGGMQPPVSSMSAASRSSIGADGNSPVTSSTQPQIKQEEIEDDDEVSLQNSNERKEAGDASGAQPPVSSTAATSRSPIGADGNSPVTSSTQPQIKQEEIEDDDGVSLQNNSDRKEAGGSFLTLTEGNARETGYPLGAFVWYNFQLISDEWHFSTGRIKIVKLNLGSRKLVFEVESGGNSDASVDEDDIAFAENCPVRVDIKGREMNGRVVCARPDAYTVLVFLEGNRRKVVGDIPRDKIKYRPEEEQRAHPRDATLSPAITESEATLGTSTGINTNDEGKSCHATQQDSELVVENSRRVTISPESKQVSERDSPIMPWKDMWAQMKSEGWALIPGIGLHNFLWVHPSAAKKKGREILRLCEEGFHYFTSEENVRQYAADNLGWVEGVHRHCGLGSKDALQSAKKHVSTTAAQTEKEVPKMKRASDKLDPKTLSGRTEGRSIPYAQAGGKNHPGADGFDPRDLVPGSRVLVSGSGKGKRTWKATILERKPQKGEPGFSIHYDGHKKSKTNWIPVFRIAGGPDALVELEAKEKIERLKAKDDCVLNGAARNGAKKGKAAKKRGRPRENSGHDGGSAEVQPPPKRAHKLPLYEGDHDYACFICFLGGDLLCCDYCERAYHLECLTPPLTEVPGGLWTCQECDPKAKRKRKKCGMCVACTRPDCGECAPCIDMPKFGGPGKMKVKCKERKCYYMRCSNATKKKKG